MEDEYARLQDERVPADSLTIELDDTCDFGDDTLREDV